MCMSCEWAPYFSAFAVAGRTPRRTVLRGTTPAAAACSSAHPASGSTSSHTPTQPAQENHASFVFRNGPIYTVAGPSPWAKALAVKGNTIAYVGDEAGAMALAGPNTQVIDLAGSLLMPGFVEAHIHPFMGAFLTSGIDLQLPT